MILRYLPILLFSFGPATWADAETVDVKYRRSAWQPNQRGAKQPQTDGLSQHHVSFPLAVLDTRNRPASY